MLKRSQTTIGKLIHRLVAAHRAERGMGFFFNDLETCLFTYIGVSRAQSNFLSGFALLKGATGWRR